MAHMSIASRQLPSSHAGPTLPSPVAAPGLFAAVDCAMIPLAVLYSSGARDIPPT